MCSIRWRKPTCSRSESVGTWEKFQIYKINDTEYGLKSAENGKYVKADLDNGGKLIAGSDP